MWILGLRKWVTMLVYLGFRGLTVKDRRYKYRPGQARGVKLNLNVRYKLCLSHIHTHTHGHRLVSSPCLLKAARSNDTPVAGSTSCIYILDLGIVLPTKRNQGLPEDTVSGRAGAGEVQEEPRTSVPRSAGCSETTGTELVGKALSIKMDKSNRWRNTEKHKTIYMSPS